MIIMPQCVKGKRSGTGHFQTNKEIARKDAKIAHKNLFFAFLATLREILYLGCPWGTTLVADIFHELARLV
jgi:hypothetical protein